MRFELDGKSLDCARRAERQCFLLTNGLGGFMSASSAFSVTRCDQGFLVAAVSPSRRFTLVHRLSEELKVGDRRCFLSSQTFANGMEPEEGWRDLVSFIWDEGPEWHYKASGVGVTRMCGMEHGANASGVVYAVENGAAEPCTLRVAPVMQLSQKGEPPQEPQRLKYVNGEIRGGGLSVCIKTNGTVAAVPARWEKLYYADDEPDGRTPTGFGAVCCEIVFTVPAGESAVLEIAFSMDAPGRSGGEIVDSCRDRQRRLVEGSGFASPQARELARAADAFIVHRASTNGKTVIAGYPFFGDWGRDTMIALPGCTLSTGRFEEAKSILRTFLAYERDGLLPNYFPEGQEEPQYNSADAPLLFVNCVWLYFERTGDRGLVREAWPVLKHIAEAYMNGTRYSISMDSDGLIMAGEGLDQVTWMDVRVGDILPTPRHGKPVEINAYWYNALCVMERLAPIAGEGGEEYARTAQLVRRSFEEKFWMEDRGYLRDVLSGTPADTQLRCNQIWAVSMPFSMLSEDKERRVVETVGAKLYTSRGLRTLSPDDPQFHPTYGGTQTERDMAYHQGTVWPFPMGAYYISYLKVHGNTQKAAGQVREMLSQMGEILTEGCVGQIPEIYDGAAPGPSKGCFAQAWSVGELLRVYEKIERIEREAGESA